ncbi:glycosyltransferase family 2 protein [Candidatus Microgenomates bacterium]|nr:glycosyltransferase family 2 protein [Candidatus Microgenomates bacterium]
MSSFKNENNSSLSIFFPCYNDQYSIKKLVEDAFKTAKSITSDCEVIVIDDGSKDNSKTVLKNLAKKYKNLNLIFHEKNMGYGAALKSGFKSATKNLIFYTDGDGQYDVKELPILLSLMTDDVDFINGFKMSRNDPSIRIVIGNIYSFLTRWLFWIPVYDVDCDFRLIRRKLLQSLDLKSNSGSICIELVKKAQLKGAKFRQVSIHHYERRWGQSQFFQLERLLSTFRELIFLWIKLIIIDKLIKRHSSYGNC